MACTSRQPAIPSETASEQSLLAMLLSTSACMSAKCQSHSTAADFATSQTQPNLCFEACCRSVTGEYAVIAACWNFQCTSIDMLILCCRK